MTLTGSERKLVFGAVTIASLQAVTWIILCLIGIIVGLTKDDLEQATSYMDTIKIYLKFIFLFSSDNTDSGLPNQIIKPLGFFFIEFFYLTFNLGWLQYSVMVVLDVLHGKERLKKDMKQFTTITAIICFLDLIIGSIFFADYNNCMSVYKDEPIGSKISMQMLCANSFLLMGVLAYKGVILWLINIEIAVCTFYVGCGLANQQVTQQA